MNNATFLIRVLNDHSFAQYYGRKFFPHLMPNAATECIRELCLARLQPKIS